MADETTPEPAPAAPARPAKKSVVLATAHGHIFDAAPDIPNITHDGVAVTLEQADRVRTVARKMNIRIVVKDA